jgi:hypothetical protein
MELSRKDAKNAKEPINLCDFAALRDISLCNILLTSTVAVTFVVVTANNTQRGDHPKTDITSILGRTHF